MPFGWRKRIGPGRFMSLNLSKRGASLTGRLGPMSSNSHTRPPQDQVAVRHVVAIKEDTMTCA
jgi:hypothetical protein